MLRLNAAGTWIQETDINFEINEPDIYALEEALRLKEKHGGEVVVCSLGPARAQQAIKEALAKGADRALHLTDPAFQGLDAHGVTLAMSRALKNEKPDLVVTDWRDPGPDAGAAALDHYHGDSGYGLVA